MTIDSARSYASSLTIDDLAKFLVEYHQLKEKLCARILGVPTGADDWLDRAFIRADQLRQCEHSLRVLIPAIALSLDNAQWESKLTICTNCMGYKTVHNEPCCVCQGTGRHPYP